MKYAHLRQIANYLNSYKKVTSIKRVADMIILIYFDKQGYFFDLSKSDSSIYTNDDFKAAKEYNAPFDIAIKKRLNNAKILNITCLENNRILLLELIQSGSYKSVKSKLYLEFTGRFTNAVLTDENDIIVDALRHTQNDHRSIKPGKELKHLPPIQIKEKSVQIILDFKEYFKDEFQRINNKNLNEIKSIKVSQINKKIENLNANLNNLENENDLLKEAEILRSSATLLLANLAKLNDYDRNFELLGFDGKIIKYNLIQSPKEATNEYFAKAKRLIQKANGLNLERNNLEEKLKFCHSMKSLLQNAKTINELQIIYPKRKNQSKNQKNESENTQSFYIGECKISVGKNQKGNAELLKNAKKDDIWMHVKDIPSAHVIIKTNKAKPSDEILEFGAKICLNMSISSAGRYEIDYTRRQNVKILNGSNVNYIHYSTIIVFKE